jgi:hypothetical protein
VADTLQAEEHLAGFGRNAAQDYLAVRRLLVLTMFRQQRENPIPKWPGCGIRVLQAIENQLFT